MHHHSASAMAHTASAAASVSVTASGAVSSAKFAPAVTHMTTSTAITTVNTSKGIFSVHAGVTIPSGARRPAEAIRNTNISTASAAAVTAMTISSARMAYAMLK